MSARIKIKWHGPRWMAKFMAGAERNMDAAAIALQSHIKEKISIGQPPSAPGEPPHVLTGHLRRNIAWDRVKALVRKVGVGIGNREKIGYALWLEFGTSKMEARPYLRPSLYEMRNELIRIMTTPIKMA